MTVAKLLSAAFLLVGTGVEVQNEEKLRVYFYLNTPDRSTREAWQGEKLDRPALAEWASALQEAVEEGTAPFLPVESRDEADVVVEIRRCQILEDGSFVLRGVVDPETIAEQFELNLLHTPRALRDSISYFPDIIRRVRQNN